MGLSRCELGSAIAVSGDSHHFANVKDALSRLESFEDVKKEHVAVLKSISIIDLTSQMTGKCLASSSSNCLGNERS